MEWLVSYFVCRFSIEIGLKLYQAGWVIPETSRKEVDVAEWDDVNLMVV